MVAKGDIIARSGVNNILAGKDAGNDLAGIEQGVEVVHIIQNLGTAGIVELVQSLLVQTGTGETTGINVDAQFRQMVKRVIASFNIFHILPLSLRHDGHLNIKLLASGIFRMRLYESVNLGVRGPWAPVGTLIAIQQFAMHQAGVAEFLGMLIDIILSHGLAVDHQ